MEEKKSTFETLVASLSKEETKKLLLSINASMKNVQLEAKHDEKEEETPQKEITSLLAKEGLFLRLWLLLLSLIKSLPIESLYQKELVNRIGRNLKEVASQYVNIPKQSYTSEFYGLLSNLRKTQLFFSSMLDCYNSEKNSFYMLVASFIDLNLYEKLLKLSSSFEDEGEDVSNTKKNARLKEIEKLSSELDVNFKEQMYSIAQAIEWMRIFCDFSLDKVLLKFSVESSNTTCSIVAIQNEIELLASILYSSKNISVPMLQTLFLLYENEKIESANKALQEQNVNESDEVTKFIKEALSAFSYVTDFKKNVPIKKIVKYVKQDITWKPIEFRGGEDWFLYFRHAWRDLFLQTWGSWVLNCKKRNITKQMLQVVKKEVLLSIAYKPWRAVLGDAELKNEVVLEFFKTFFQTVYPAQIMPCLKVILTEGSFYKANGLQEYTLVYDSLAKTEKEIKALENEFSPESVIGTSFDSILKNGVLTIKTKTQVESLVKNIEGDIKRLSVHILDTLKEMNKILLHIIVDEGSSKHSILTNWSSIKGSDNKKFQEEVVSINNIIQDAINLSLQIGSLS